MLLSCAETHDLKPCGIGGSNITPDTVTITWPNGKVETFTHQRKEISLPHVCGFWCGAWHGLIVECAFIGSLFNKSIAIYEINNNGGWYNFGYVGGLFLVIRALPYVLVFLFKIIFG